MQVFLSASDDKCGHGFLFITVSRGVVGSMDAVPGEVAVVLTLLTLENVCSYSRVLDPSERRCSRTLSVLNNFLLQCNGY